MQFKALFYCIKVSIENPIFPIQLQQSHLIESDEAAKVNRTSLLVTNLMLVKLLFKLYRKRDGQKAMR